MFWFFIAICYNVVSKSCGEEMLINLKIKNIALIKEANIDFKKGLNIITGETGAGKSLLVDSLNFVLGERADKTLIKHGEEFARVDAVFEVDIFNDTVKEFFDMIGLEAEDTVRITRQMNLEGKNECRVNGEQITINMLKKLTNELVDIHGQHEHQALLNPKNHLTLLDGFQEEQVSVLKENLKVLLNDLGNINQKIELLGGLDEDREKNIELLDFDIQEIEQAKLETKEEDDLEKKRSKMQNSEKLFENLSQAYGQLNSGFSMESSMKSMINSLHSVEMVDEQILKMKEELESLRFEFLDWQEEFLDYYQHLDYNEEELNAIEERLEVIKDLKRKYGLDVSGILSHLQELKEKKEMFLHCTEQLEECMTTKEEILNSIYNTCLKLTEVRKNIASVVEQAILMELKDLGMYNANFKVQFADTYTKENIENTVSMSGADKIEFLFSANLGEPLKPLSKIISGGEMSRFMLAIKCVLNADDYMRTLLFDEIDTGIGGKVGGMVGQKLYKLGTKNQVICITHLSSIACFADHHMLIEKSSDEEHTFTSLKSLSEEDKVLELMRMNGMEATSNYGYLQAKEMLKDAERIMQQYQIAK